MAACERCWADAYLRTMTDPSKSQVDHYHDLLAERPTPCGTAQPEPRIMIERDANGSPRRLYINRKLHPFAAMRLRQRAMEENVAASVPQLRRGKVWCIKCGKVQDVDAAECMRAGWPKCHGQTMTIDSPEERARHR